LSRRIRPTAKLASEAVAELQPELREVPVILGQDDAEGVERWFRGNDVAGELDLALFRVEGNQEHVVDRQQRPDQQDKAEDYRAHFDEEPMPSGAPASRAAGCRGGAHSCSSRV
jgi:hypothetical protein